MMSLVIDKLIEVLSTQPDAVLPTSSIGAKRPSTGAEVPAIAVSLVIGNAKGTGLGRFRRAGETVAQNVAIVEVQPAPETFSDDLRSLRLAPLPLKKNPAALTESFSEEDVQVRNVTAPASPITYTLVEQPTQKVEYGLNPYEARIIFGAAQTLGDKLEVVHWTVTWRDEILGDMYSGVLTLEIWANSASQTAEISRGLQTRVQTALSLLRQKGFVKLQPSRLASAEHVLHQPPTGSAFAVWKQELSYAFVFDSQEGGELSSGVPIKRIDVDIKRHAPESFSVT